MTDTEVNHQASAISRQKSLCIAEPFHYLAFHDLCQVKSVAGGGWECSTCHSWIAEPEKCPLQAPANRPRPYQPVVIADDRETPPPEDCISDLQGQLHRLCDPTRWDQDAESTKAAIREKRDFIESWRLLCGPWHRPELVWP